MLYEKSSGHKDMTISREGALGTACNNNINTMAEKRERNAISCHATQDSKVLFVWKGSQKEERTLSLQCLLLPDGAVGCTRSNITAGRRVREKQTLDSRSLMTAGTLDRYWCVSVMEILDFVYFKVWYCVSEFQSHSQARLCVCVGV